MLALDHRVPSPPPRREKALLDFAPARDPDVPHLRTTMCVSRRCAGPVVAPVLLRGPMITLDFKAQTVVITGGGSAPGSGGMGREISLVFGDAGAKCRRRPCRRSSGGERITKFVIPAVLARPPHDRRQTPQASRCCSPRLTRCGIKPRKPPRPAPCASRCGSGSPHG